MEGFAKPAVVCSRCMGFENCRYNGQMLKEPLVEALKPFVDFITPCPEKDMGLGAPRHPVRVMSTEDGNRLMQLITGEDVTGMMNVYCEGFFRDLGTVDGFILKSRSPSCGLFDVKYYPPGEKVPPQGKGAGFFGREVLKRYRGLAVEDEARLSNERIREHFLTKLFTLADFRRVTKPSDLVGFQSRHKLLLMAYSQKEMREMGRIVAHQKEAGFEDSLLSYSEHLQAAFERGPSSRSHVNVLEHAFGYFSKGLNREERVFFLENVEMYREGRTPLLTLLSLLVSWIARFDEGYLRDQSYFEPFPMELRRRFDKHRTRDYWGR